MLFNFPTETAMKGSTLVVTVFVVAICEVIHGTTGIF